MIDVNMRECIFESMLMGFACDCGGLFYKGPIKRRNCCGCPDEILKIYSLRTSIAEIFME